MNRPSAIATGHPAATEAAVDIIRSGGSAVDAAIAADAVMGVVEPAATGIGGDLLALVDDGDRVRAYNGCGRSSASLGAQPHLRSGASHPSDVGGQAVTVPGAVRGWWDLHQDAGRLPWRRILAPAVDAAARGCSVGEVAAAVWRANVGRLDDAARRLYAPDGPPGAGSTWVNTELAHTLSLLADGGPEALYEGELAAEIAAAVLRADGAMTPADLALHAGEWTRPVYVELSSGDVYTPPPSCQGTVLLLALSQLVDTAHPDVLDEVRALDRAFAVGQREVYDRDRPALGELEQWSLDAAHAPLHGVLPYGPGTVYSAVAHDGVVVSLVSSVCDRFGSGVGVPGRGFVLQSRGRGFSLQASHPNVLAPAKRPYTTIIPTIVRHSDGSTMALGVVGGTMQPQGQLQILDRIWSGVALQDAVDLPRFRLLGEGLVALEDGVDPSVAGQLHAGGYTCVDGAGVDFGGAQIVTVADGEASAASDRRKDGVAVVLDGTGSRGS